MVYIRIVSMDRDYYEVKSILGGWRTRGVIEINRRRSKIINFTGLEKFAKGSF